uniref:Uncharacterized protein n=1 Tax=Lactuca sativa TaxID=4236 RepID=A0A9R1X9Z0_LACSA|nr:hypothetical protein LSAT_V11C500247710 [Lactuca sativa]
MNDSLVRDFFKFEEWKSLKNSFFFVYISSNSVFPTTPIILILNLNPKYVPLHSLFLLPSLLLSYLSSRLSFTKVLPTLVKLFASNEQAIRVGLLQHIDQLGNFGCLVLVVWLPV